MPFAYPEINVVAILVAALAQFVLGFLWYAGMTPTGKRWAAEMGLGDQSGQAGAAMAVFPIGSILAAWTVAIVYGWSGAADAMDGILVGWVVALAVGAQAAGASVASGKGSLVLHAINAGYLVVGYALMGAIIGAFG
ncbi:MAG: DUF1761 domain-containing protein [Dehalococcoidia bacterium]|nr:DUF1761 domain-containing protein [Dehalococcoidia bacterium]